MDNRKSIYLELSDDQRSTRRISHLFLRTVDPERVARFYVDVKDEAGKVMNWNFELGSPNVLKRQGWKRDSLKVGDQVTVDGYLAKDGTRGLANARRVTLADGRNVFAGSSADGTPAVGSNAVGSNKE